MPMPTAAAAAPGRATLRRATRAMDLDGAADRVERLVGAAEVREHRVADELVDVAAELADQVGLQLQVAVEHGDGFFGRAPLGERGEAADVGEEQRDHLPASPAWAARRAGPRWIISTVDCETNFCMSARSRSPAVIWLKRLRRAAPARLAPAHVELDVEAALRHRLGRRRQRRHRRGDRAGQQRAGADAERGGEQAEQHQAALDVAIRRQRQIERLERHHGQRRRVGIGDAHRFEALAAQVDVEHRGAAGDVGRRPPRRPAGRQRGAGDAARRQDDDLAAARRRAALLAQRSSTGAAAATKPNTVPPASAGTSAR